MSLSDNDLVRISLLVTNIIKEQLDEKFEEVFKMLPSKEEFFSRMDTLSGEYTKIDGSQTIQEEQISRHEDKLAKHEKRISTLEHRAISKPV